MKILLITYSRTRNYGGVLQAYGLYRYLELKGYDVKFIDYIPRRSNIYNKEGFVEEAISKSKIWGINGLTKWAFLVIRYPEMIRSFRPFIEFMDVHAKFTKRYSSLEELLEDPPYADVYISGSDQIWNSQFTSNQNLDLPYYLSFVNDNQKKISYASSFGRTFLPEKDRLEVARLLSRYTVLSVREESGQEILKSLGLSGNVVVDPTVLCPIMEWERFVLPQSEKNYLLLYMVSFHKETYNMARRIAKAMSKKLIIVSLDSQDRWKIKGNLFIAPTIPEWLSFIKYADGVITDSFHASVFSILFKRKFIVNSGSRDEISTRIHQLLGNLDLQEREIKDTEWEKEFKRLDSEIDWQNCDRKLNLLRDETILWLDSVLRELEYGC